MKSGSEHDTLQQKITLAKETHIANISQAFEKLKIPVSISAISNSFDKLTRLGVTNIFLTVESNDKSYLVRINGQLWPPYTRSHEAKVLDIAKECGIDTLVLFNDSAYQICEKLDSDLSLETILKTANPDNIIHSFELLSAELAKCHQAKPAEDAVDYPIKKMIDDAIGMMEKKWQEKIPARLNVFAKLCEEIVSTISAIPHQTFCHNDLLPSSVFIDLKNSKVSIVDWEYSGLAHYSNDLAILGCHLTKEQNEELLHLYYSKCGINKEQLPEEKKNFQANLILHEFLRIAWKVTPNNILEHHSELEKLNELTEAWISNQRKHKMKM